MLTSHQIHLIRSSGLTDSHWAQKLKVQRQTIYYARTGRTHADHPTPVDTVPRKGGGRMAGKMALRLRVNGDAKP